jgi:dihydrofolate reductase
MIGSIWAQTRAGVIGRDGGIPWRYRGDFVRFKRVTMGSAIVMGRRTFDSIGKPLPGRVNIVLTSRVISASVLDGVTSSVVLLLARSVDEAIGMACDHDVWFIGGADVYAAAMPLVDVVDVTYVPDDVPVDGSVLAPEVDPALFRRGPEFEHEDEPALRRCVWRRR